MRKKILLLTTIYPAPDLEYGTPSIHYFTREWVKMGFEVNVIHFQAVYPSIFYLFAKLCREKIASKTGAVVFTRKEKEDKHYNMDGVSIYRFPVFKKIPHGRYSGKVIINQVNKIIEIYEREGYSPETIIGHFSNPQLEIIPHLKQFYSARTCMIMHDVGKSIKSTFKKEYENLMSNIDIWGYRSIPIQRGFEENFGKPKHSFLCYSGIPAHYISKINPRSFIGNLSQFAYVGELIKRKNPVVLVSAINKVYPEGNYQISYIGRGAEKVNILKLSNSLKTNELISFIGYIPRDEIQTVLDNTECMIMISENETFGLVYLEAMARGCLTIGSRNEGIDGVIEHGKNGFLCKSGDENELAEIIREINSLTPNNRKQISDNAIATALELTDYKAAKTYLDAVNYYE
ncbi:MAG: hypothetical protein A2W98_00380 [Bacteroidetes bacterium GWF2_33_38]|nr:MAG: hypothetical protein A2W98_00380 [Bacteroidetes bacterium GWF2_33_38]